MILSNTEESLQAARCLLVLGILLRMGFLERNPAATASKMGGGGGGAGSGGGEGSMTIGTPGVA